MSTRLSAVLAGLCGVFGAVAFGMYGLSVLFPFPAAAPVEAWVAAFAAPFRLEML
jgi:hypothetical protein